jgi:hypothetical protein
LNGLQEVLVGEDVDQVDGHIGRVHRGQSGVMANQGPGRDTGAGVPRWVPVIGACTTSGLLCMRLMEFLRV